MRPPGAGSAILAGWSHARRRQAADMLLVALLVLVSPTAIGALLPVVGPAPVLSVR